MSTTVQSWLVDSFFKRRGKGKGIGQERLTLLLKLYRLEIHTLRWRRQ
jgi:hypothetical protein